MPSALLVVGAAPPEALTAYGLVSAIIIGFLVSAAIAVLVAIAVSSVNRSRHHPRLHH